MPHSILTIKLTWMINYHLRSISSCFVSFPENNTLEMKSVPLCFILVLKSNYNTFHNSTSNRPSKSNFVSLIFMKLGNTYE